MSSPDPGGCRDKENFCSVSKSQGGSEIPARKQSLFKKPLDVLKQLGFSTIRAENALAATGHRNAQIATDWILARINDPEIDREIVRNYVLYLCPGQGLFRDQLETFWDASRVQIGWNGAHNSFPHITLTSPFKISSKNVESLVEISERISLEFLSEFESNPIGMEHYHSPNFLGLFVEKKSEGMIKLLSHRLIEKISEAFDINVEPPTSKSFHLTLAYQFKQPHFEGLKDLTESIDVPDSNSQWELRLYSYEDRAKSQDVYKVLTSYLPDNNDELELMADDYIYICPEQMRMSTDRWILGTSWLTGCKGYLLKENLERTAETNGWTLHLSSSLNNDDKTPFLPSDAMFSSLLGPNSSISSSSLERLKSNQKSHQPNQTKEIYNKSEDHEKETKFTLSRTSFKTKESRRVYIIRHGERVDFTFGTWIPFCFDEKGIYTQKDLNMPKSVPKRKSGPEGYALDCPLTCMGKNQAQLVGKALANAGVHFSHAFSSPSLRCIETCKEILNSMDLDNKIKINLEPGLFEWLAWYQTKLPNWMSSEELIQAGFNVNENYKPYISANELHDTIQETCEQYYTRNSFVSQCIFQASEEAGGNILFVAHSTSLDTCTRQLIGKSPRPFEELLQLARQIPYCSLSAIEENIGPDGKPTWKMIPSPIAPLTHCANSRYDWKIFSNQKPLTKK